MIFTAKYNCWDLFWVPYWWFLFVLILLIITVGWYLGTIVNSQEKMMGIFVIDCFTKCEIWCNIVKGSKEKLIDWELHSEESTVNASNGAAEREKDHKRISTPGDLTHLECVHTFAIFIEIVHEMHIEGKLWKPKIQWLDGGVCALWLGRDQGWEQGWKVLSTMLLVLGLWRRWGKSVAVWMMDEMATTFVGRRILSDEILRWFWFSVENTCLLSN